MSVVSGALALVVAGAVYIFGVKHYHWAVVGPVLHLRWVRAYLVDPRFRQLIQVMDDEQVEIADSFAVLWNANHTELISRRLFRPVEMYGVLRYMHKPDVKKLEFVAGAAGFYRRMEMEDTPALRQALSGLDTQRLFEASYDGFGFRHVDAELIGDCATHVLFLGDSFTDGANVNDSETFVNRYGHLVRDRLRRGVCPVNTGVDGYGSLEESYVLETYFDALGRPPVIVLMHYPNDVAVDEDAVIDGTLPDSPSRWETSLMYLRRVAEFARKRGVTVLIAAIPPKAQFARPATRRNYQEVLRHLCLQEGIRFIDLFDRLNRSGSRDAYFEDDPHWTPKGHQIAAEALYEETKDLVAAAASPPARETRVPTARTRTPQ